MHAIAKTLSRKKDLPIASLIDVVFLLLVYFMVTSSLIKKEADLPFQLSVPIVKHSMPDQAIEVLIEISETGIISIEGAEYSDPQGLTQQLATLRAVAKASGNQLVVSVLPRDKTLHGSIIPVMDACAAAKVNNLSFNTVM